MSISNLQKSVRDKIISLGSKKKNACKEGASYTYFHQRILLDFVKFIDTPLCFNKNFKHLYHCQSTSKPLQERQRANLVKLVTVLFTYTDVENLQIGVSDSESMKAVPHYSVRSRFEKIWGVEITKSKYYKLIKLLKLAGYLEIEAIFILDKDVLSNAKFKAEDLSRVKSKAAYKSFTVKFFSLFDRLYEMNDVIDSRQKSIAKRISLGLKNIWETYSPFSDSYHYNKRKNKANLKRNNETRYPQAFT